ncbi:hypothetical protein [Natronosalvus halobius]|uniref:hypothetical protein n=1 Tax=Natronosalvus halobius TaxID=2953746 RepID=UPI0020A14E19|nr:hypothetical protein [Natronosalvus halobius]USZ70470.1 hypothetical protein NGM15_10125 [Natronosalvus halobius]
MSTSNTQQANPFENPMVRYALGLSGAAIIASSPSSTSRASFATSRWDSRSSTPS